MTGIQSKYAKQIDLAIALPGSISELGKAPLVIAGTKQMLPVYRIPIDLLAFNLRNGRYAAELRAEQARLGRTLEPRDPEDAKILQRLLLTEKPDATDILKEDLRRVGQTDPGIITFDGSVINANRRMAVLMDLHQEEPTGKFQYLEAMRLPEGISEKDLWRIEAGLQLSDDKRLPYGPINDLLKIREGIDAGLKLDEIAASLYGVNDPKAIAEKDERLRLIDSFLDFIGSPGAYSEVNNKVEHFINLQNILSWMTRQGVKARERHAFVLRAFELIRTNKFGHMDIRMLRDIYRSEAAKKVFVQGVEPKEGPQPADAAKQAEKVREAFDTARDIVLIEKESEKPERLVARAERLLRTLLAHQDLLRKRADLRPQVASLSDLAGQLSRACTPKAGVTKTAKAGSRKKTQAR